MNLITTFKDYYDGCLAYDNSNDIFYRLQDTIEEYFGENPRGYRGRRPWYCRHEIDKKRYDSENTVLGFCGKLYMLRILLSNSIEEYPDIHLYPYLIDKDREFCDSLDERLYGYKKINPVEKERAFQDKNKKLLDLFDEFECFSFLKLRNDIYIHPCLNDLGFPRIMDSYSAYQEILMWDGKQAVAQENVTIPTGDDEVLACSKGYDEFSFRANKGKSKRINRKEKCN